MNEKPRREVGEDPQGKKKADAVIEKCTGKQMNKDDGHEDHPWNETGGN